MTAFGGPGPALSAEGRTTGWVSGLVETVGFARVQRQRGRAPVGPCLGRYELRANLGQGGMGQVFAAWDPALERELAIKVLSCETAGSAALQEARCLARVSHPNVVPVYEVDRDGAQVFIAMALVDGPNLRRWLTQGQPSWRRILTILIAACRGVAAIHASGLCHGDIKPSNILVYRDGRACVADLGLARREGAARRDGRRGGTPAYMPPEWRKMDGTGETGEIGCRGDQYSLCVTATEALFGGPPGSLQPGFWGRRGWRSKVVRPIPRAARNALGRVLVRGLSPLPGDRWPDVDALADALSRVEQEPGRGSLVVSSLVLVGLLGVGGGAAIGPRIQAACCEAPEQGRPAALGAMVMTPAQTSGRGFGPPVREGSDPPSWLEQRTHPWSCLGAGVDPDLRTQSLAVAERCARLALGAGAWEQAEAWGRVASLAAEEGGLDQARLRIMVERLRLWSALVDRGTGGEPSWPERDQIWEGMGRARALAARLGAEEALRIEIQVLGAHALLRADPGALGGPWLDRVRAALDRVQAVVGPRAGLDRRLAATFDRRLATTLDLTLAELELRSPSGDLDRARWLAGAVRVSTRRRFGASAPEHLAAIELEIELAWAAGEPDRALAHFEAGAELLVERAGSEALAAFCIRVRARSAGWLIDDREQVMPAAIGKTLAHARASSASSSHASGTGAARPRLGGPAGARGG